MTDTVEVTRHGQITVITMRREAKRNAIDASITAGIDKALNDFEDDPDQWCAVLTGGTLCFSAGADLASGPGEPTPRGGIGGIITRIRSKPLIAAVEGVALGGGLELVLCCDLVVAATDARFGLPEPKRGLMADFGGAFRVARHFPPNLARELLLTAEPIGAARAERLGFVNRLTEPGAALPAALAMAEQICANAPLAVRASLKVAEAAISGDESALWELSDRTHAGLLRTADVAEGVAAFLEKRPAHWTGK
ncbi:enoyl-CoA hydratase-related protein [Nocardia sp. alder85J]|uniref:enoyl-CoA hydratase-related protein n=1 Tax=Nocardia sp. alder85J TaxID=2862949 RepID=UPI001CD39EFB|nr:enoyl-CoA hydratase-related protein [Nocardia sp. alder85J]MCX4090989.1 enoyl-CoA hydratase-related protein [Nocardia sp. alder85J]